MSPLPLTRLIYVDGSPQVLEHDIWDVRVAFACCTSYGPGTFTLRHHTAIQSLELQHLFACILKNKTTVIRTCSKNTSSASQRFFLPYTLAAGALWYVAPWSTNEPVAIKDKHVIEEQTFSMLAPSSGTAAAMSCFS
jgi:hypothetical protein